MTNDEFKLHDEATRGERASELMDDPLMVEAFTLMQERFTAEWADSPVRDTEGRERIWMMQKLLQNVRSHLLQAATTGKLASLQLEQKRSMAQKAKQWASETF